METANILSPTLVIGDSVLLLITGIFFIGAQPRPPWIMHMQSSLHTDLKYTPTQEDQASI